MDNGDWLDWAGGECPVAGDVLVEARFRDGTTLIGEAGPFDWTHEGWRYSITDENDDIIAYRRLGDPA